MDGLEEAAAYQRWTPSRMVRSATRAPVGQGAGRELLAERTTEIGHSEGVVGAEATAGIEPAMKVLQTSALPLGYVA